MSGGSDGKESTCNAGDQGSIPESWRSPWEGNDYPPRYSCLENSMDRGAWQTTDYGVTRLRHDWATSTHMCMVSHFSHGYRNQTPSPEAPAWQGRWLFTTELLGKPNTHTDLCNQDTGDTHHPKQFPPATPLWSCVPPPLTPSNHWAFLRYSLVSSRIPSSGEWLLSFSIMPLRFT